MKKIISAAQTRAADLFTIQNEPITSIELMERASLAFVNKLKELYGSDGSVLVVAGSGNNGGDGLAIARLLKEAGYRVETILLRFGPELSADCEANYKRLRSVAEFTPGSHMPKIQADLIIDAVFGSGLNRPVTGWLKAALEQVNLANKPIVSVDLPSGLIADTISLESTVIRASHTITFQRPKLSFLIPESGEFCGQVHVVDIGLDEKFIETQPSNSFLVEADDVQMPNRTKFDHKGSFGHLQIFAGSKGKIGAAFLAAKASLRTGVGLTTIHTASCGMPILQTNLPEAMVVPDIDEEVITSGKLIPKASAVCLGPGIGTHKATEHWFASFIQNLELPAILDADAINMLAQNQDLLSFLPKGTILTPHLGELERLLGPSQHGLDRIEKVKKLTKRYGIYVLIKGAHSVIVTPQGQAYFNTTGNAGMATAGSGDVLAGIVGSFLAQGSKPFQSLVSAVYIHGLSGDLAKQELGEASIMASDLLKYLPKSISNVNDD